MSIQTRHFVLTPDGIREFSASQAAGVATGLHPIPELACRRVRYLQLTLSDEDQKCEIQATGACIEFDESGRLQAAAAPERPNEHISRFEYDACVHWALRESVEANPTLH